MSDFVQQCGTVCEFTGSDSWVILSPIELSIKRKIEAVGTPLKDWDVNIYRGVLTGCNEAFIISTEKRNEILSNCKDDDERTRTEALIRPILRGRDIKRYSYEWANLWLIATFPSRHYDIEKYPAVKAHLESYYGGNGRKVLEQTGTTHIINGEKVKSRKKTNNKWFETQDSINYWEDFSQPKIVWGNLNLNPSFALVNNDFYINAPSPMIVPASYYLLGILNSKVADYYIRKLGVTRNGGYFEYKPMFVEKLPVPKQSTIINTIENAVIHNEEMEINRLIYLLYGFSSEEISFIENQ